jgi:ankyrin repeat protein
MYLLLRTKEVDKENQKTGHNVFVTYMLRKDKTRMKIVLTRGANINYVNRLEGKTPLHIAIESRLPPDIVKLLLKNGANPHFEDFEGMTCMEKALEYEPYREIKSLSLSSCHHQIRINPLTVLKEQD